MKSEIVSDPASKPASQSCFEWWKYERWHVWCSLKLVIMLIICMHCHYSSCFFMLALFHQGSCCVDECRGQLLLTLHSLRECVRFECRQSREDNYHCGLSRISTDFYMRYVELHRHEFLSLSRSIHRQHMHKTGLDFRIYIYLCWCDCVLCVRNSMWWYCTLHLSVCIHGMLTGRYLFLLIMWVKRGDLAFV